MTTTISDEFAPAEESIAWAESAAAELRVLIDNFFKHDVAKIAVEIDPLTGESVQKLKFKADIPKDFRRKATEALNNARHSFDQSVFAARNILAIRSAKGVNYPWSRDLTDLKRLLQERGIDPRLWDTIIAHEPYGAWNANPSTRDLIRTLATIANNKHTVGLSVNGSIAQTSFPSIVVKSGSSSLANPQWDARKNEAELMRWKGEGIEIHGDYNFVFTVCLKDARFSQPVDALLALQIFTEKAKSVCDSIRAKCCEIAD